MNPIRFDIGILGGRIVDGAGNPWYYGDLGIAGKKISKIGRIDRKECENVVRADDLYVCPGFIDIHTHSDVSALLYPGCDSTIRQGVTTHLVGNCGQSAAPVRGPYADLWREHYWFSGFGYLKDWDWESFGQYLSHMEKKGVGHNIAGLVGHGTVRAMVLGSSQAAPTPKELRLMKSLVDESMRDGAFGLSTGLVYPPGCYAKTDEIIEMCKVVAKYGGIYTSHIRGERETVLDAIKEAVLIGEKSGVSVQISHNCPKVGAWGRTKETLRLAEEARIEGLDVTVDNDVHTDLEESMSASLPQYLHAIDKQELFEILKDPGNRRRIKKEIIEDEHPGAGYVGLLKHGMFDRIFLMEVPRQKDLEGKTVAQVAEERRRDPYETFFDLILEEKDKIVTLYDYILEEDVKALLVHPLVMVSSDGSTRSIDHVAGDSPGYSPCAFGEYPGIFERYVRDEAVLTIQEAVRKMTSFPAQRLGLLDRGLLRPGMRADIAVIDLARIRDRATNLWPHAYPYKNYPPKYPEGIPHVIVNGTVAVKDGKQTKARAGEVLRHKWP